MDAKRERYGYEWGCQVIVARSLRWMREHAVESEFPKHTEFRDITGIAIPENEAAKKMEDYILQHEKLHEFGVTGAMMQYSIRHAKYRFFHGDDKYFDQFRDKPDKIFDFDESDAFPENEHGQ